MRHTKIHSLIEKIKQIEIEELAEAVKAHGKEYSWEEDDDAPIVALNFDSMYPNPIDVIIRRVWIDPNGRLQFIGCEKSDAYTLIDSSTSKVYFTDFFAGHISFITESIPATESKLSVSCYRDLTLFDENDAIDLCELTSSGMSEWYANDCGGRDEFFAMVAREWLPEFRKIREAQDWSGNVHYYDLVDEFINKKFAAICDRQEDKPTVNYKFEIGSHVWFMSDNKVHTAKIVGVNLQSNGTLWEVVYTLETGYDGSALKMHENYLYKSKEGLLNSL